MSMKDRFVGAVRSSTNLGLRRASRVLWASYGLLMVVVIYLTVSYSSTDISASVTLTQIAESETPHLADDMELEQGMIESLGAGEMPQFSTALHGYPILYALPMATLYEAYGNRALALFNVACLLLTMLVVQRLGVEFWSCRGAVGDIMSLDKHTEDLGIVIDATFSDDASTGQAPDELQTPVTATLFGVVAMLVFAVNPIVFGEATRPSPRPFAYLLSTLALYLSLRVLRGKSMPKLLCMLLVAAAGLVHLPAILVALPVVLIASFGDLVTSVEQRTWVQKLGANSRAVLIAILVTALLPFAGNLLSYFDSIREPLQGFVDQYASEFLIAAGLSLRKYVDIVSVHVGTFLKLHAPLLALLATVPKPEMKGVVERTMAFYGAGLLAFFTFVLPSPDSAQLYPAMLPLSILAAVGIVNALQVYIRDTAREITRLSLRFFGTLAAMPLIGSAMTWFSSLRVEKLYEELNRSYSPYTTLVAVIAVLGLSWQLLKRRRQRRDEPAKSD